MLVEEQDLYDKYTIRLTRMKLELISPSASKSEPRKRFVDDISFDIIVENCLEPLHEQYPTIRLNVAFTQAAFEVDLAAMEKVQKLLDTVLITFENKDTNKVAAEVQKKIEFEFNNYLLREEKKNKVVQNAPDAKVKLEMTKIRDLMGRAVQDRMQESALRGIKEINEEKRMNVDKMRR